MRADTNVAPEIDHADGYTLEQTSSPDLPSHALVGMKDYFAKATFIPGVEFLSTDAALLTPQINFVELLGSDSLVYGYLGADKRGVRLAARLHAASAQAHDGALPLTFEAQHMHLFDPASTRRIDF